eukprot:m.35158 g.35158  ORF g.35158 m.35158 type:complete len:112 (+) comp8844_c0_seq1:306-641(+)
MTICPYKLVLILVTAIFAVLVAFGSTDEQTQDHDDKKRRKRSTKDMTWAEWLEYQWVSFRSSYPGYYRASYVICVSLLFVLHFEIFSGGYICRQLFAKNATQLNATSPIVA